MTTPRKKTSNFSSPKESEEVSVETLLDENATEMFETISRNEEEVPFVPQEITPTPDAGPRFVEEPVVAKPPTPAPQLQPAPKRHPRNIPKFSRFK